MEIDVEDVISFNIYKPKKKNSWNIISFFLYIFQWKKIEMRFYSISYNCQIHSISI